MSAGSIYDGDDLRVDVCCSGEVVRIAAPVLVVRVLVDTNVVYAHSGREWQVIDIDEAEVLRHAQVHDKVLRGMSTARLH